jgi:para-aminobenzoate synthetase / 4-amino-4-deoxychorismate lyase
VRRIAEGELFQANLCLRLEGRFEGDPLDAFADASAELRPAMGAFLGLDDGAALLSFSPELFLRREGRTAWSSPIKGTAPRPPHDEDAAAAGRAALVASAKDAAEHVMIVDLVRNDLGRVARYGTVTADPAPRVEPHPGLWHLVSTVRAELREDASDGDLVRAAFPPGSVTGAPKVQALHVIHTLEGTAREAYTGAIGFVSPVAGLELNVAIRTFEVAGEQVWLGCGGGIVADSDPDAELEEALGKARPLVQALGGRVAAPGPWRHRRVPPLLDAPRPDPALGLLETMRVLDGEPEHLHAHLERLGASARALPDGLEHRVREAAAAAGAGVHRLRIVLGDGQATVTTGPATVPDPVALDRVCVPGGLGAHKWADRGALTAPALIVDADGAVLESTSANVWIAEGDRLVTPPADGRILPGVTRARLLGLAGLETAVEEIDLDRLEAADHVVLSSSIRIVTPVGPAAAPLAARLRDALSAGSAPSRSARPRAGRDASAARGR